MPPQKDEHQQLQDLMLENQRLLTENNKLLQDMKKMAKLAFWIRIASILVLLGAPLVLYYWFLEPYFNSLGSSFEIFINGMQEIPGWKQFYETAVSRQ